RVRWVVGELPTAGEMTIHRDPYGARKWRRTRHRIAVRIAARVVKSSPAHVIIVCRDSRVAILAVETLRRRLDEEGRTRDVCRVERRRPWNAVLEISAPRPIDLSAVAHGPVLRSRVGFARRSRWNA